MFERPPRHVISVESAREELDYLLAPENRLETATNVIYEDQAPAGGEDSIHLTHRKVGGRGCEAEIEKPDGQNEDGGGAEIDVDTEGDNGEGEDEGG